MHLIKLDATRSTNEFLKDLWQNNQAKDRTIVWAMDQYGGRGQQGTIWTSEAGKNLTFSVLCLFDDLDIKDQFLLNEAVSISIYEALKELGIPELCIKWPNDIMSGADKICGVLIENIVKAQNLKSAVIGIGINVNQEEFIDLPRASSLKLKGGIEYDLEEVLKLVVYQLELQLALIQSADHANLKSAYEQAMYRINVVSSFEHSHGSISNGIIRGISNTGELLVEMEDSLQSFGMKEIKLLN